MRVVFIAVICLLIICSVQSQTLLRTLTSQNPEAGTLFGFNVRGVGDLDGDHIPDMAVGANGEMVAGVTAAGRVYLYRGSDFSVYRALQSPRPFSGAKFGQTFSQTANYDNDSLPDFIVGAYGDSVGNLTQAGKAYIIGLATGNTIRTLQSPNPQLTGWFGHAVAGIDDVTGDSIGDLLVGARKEHAQRILESGRAYVFNGATGALVYTLESPNAEASGWFGTLVGNLGDLNNDSRSEFYVSASQETVGGMARAGRVYVYSGATGTLFRTLQSPHPQANSGYGVQVDAFGDYNGDNLTDIVVSAQMDSLPQWNTRGVAYVLSPATNELLTVLYSTNPNPLLMRGVAGLGDVTGDTVGDFIAGSASAVYLFNGTTGTMYNTINAPVTGGFFGSFVDGLGDITGDRRGDFIVGDYGVNGQIGAAYVYSGVTLSTPERNSPALPTGIVLNAYPNPFNSSTTISFSLPKPGAVTLSVFDITGRNIATLVNGYRSAGSYRIPFDAGALPSGVYVYQLSSGGLRDTRTLTILK